MRTSTRAVTMSVFDGNFGTKLRWMIVFGLVLPLLGAACSSGTPEGAAHAQQGEPGDPVATVLIYSGRPNPTFNLGPTVAEDLISLVNSAEPLDGYEKSTVLPSILGYNGFLVENRSGQGALPRRLIVYQGAIEIRGGEAGNGETRFSRDSARSVERFLFEQAMTAEVLDERGMAIVKDAVGIRDDPEMPADETDSKKE